MKARLTSMMAFMVILVLIVSTLAGCGSADNKAPGSDSSSQPSIESTSEAASGEATEPEEVKTITGMVWGGTEAASKINEEIRKAFPELDKKIKVEFVVGGTHDADVAKKLRLAFSANESVCDFVGLNYTQVPEFASAGVLVDVSSAVAQYKDQLLPGALSLTKYNGKTVAFVNETKPRLWYYRTDMFDTAGIDVAQVKNLDDFIEAGKKLQAKYPQSYIWNFGKSMQGYSYFMTLSGNKARFVDDNGNYIVDTDPGIRSMLEAYKKMNDAGIILDVSDWTPDWEKAFSDGTLASTLGARWLAQPVFLNKWAAGQEGKWACAQWPSITGETGGSDAGGSVFVIPSFSREPELAMEYLAKMTLSKEGTLAAFREFGNYPINKEAAADPKVHSPDAFYGESLAIETEKALNNLQVFSYTPAAAQETTILLPYFDKVINNQMDIDKALKAAQKDLESQIGNPFGK